MYNYSKSFIGNCWTSLVTYKYATLIRNTVTLQLPLNKLRLKHYNLQKSAKKKKISSKFT